MEKVYICTAFRGDVEENARKAREYCRWAAVEYGALPIAPHLLFPQFLDDNDPVQRELGINMGLELLADCKQLFYFGDVVTEGMDKEMNEARVLGIPVEHISEEKLSATESTEKGGMRL